MEHWLLPSRTVALPAAPGLDRILGRATELPDIGRGLDAWLAAEFGLYEVPWAGLLRSGTDAGARDWLIADLVSVRVEPTTARIVAHAGAILQGEACAALGAALEPWLLDEGFSMHPFGPGRWLIGCPDATPPPQSAALDAAIGVDLREIQPGSRAWQRRSNEMQILLTQQTLNQSRVAQGLPSANSLWFWGFGRLPAIPSVPAIGAVASPDPLLIALAQHAAVPVIAADAAHAGALVRDLRDPTELARVWGQGTRPGDANLRFADGSGVRVKAWDRLRFWR